MCGQSVVYIPAAGAQRWNTTETHSWELSVQKGKKKNIAQEDRQFLSAESLKEEGVTGTGGRDRYQQLHFLSFKRPALVECPQAAAQCPRPTAQERL